MTRPTPPQPARSASSRARAKLELAEQDYRAACEELADAAMVRGAELESRAYAATNALRFDDAARGLFRTHATLTAARAATSHRKKGS